MRILDSDILIDLSDKNLDILAWFSAIPDRPGVPIIVKLELLNGCHDPFKYRRMNKFLSKFPTVYATEADQERALANFMDMHLSNAIGVADIMIAEIAVGLDAIHYTGNEKHFKAIPGLK